MGCAASQPQTDDHPKGRSQREQEFPGKVSTRQQPPPGATTKKPKDQKEQKPKEQKEQRSKYQKQQREQRQDRAAAAAAATAAAGGGAEAEAGISSSSSETGENGEGPSISKTTNSSRASSKGVGGASPRYTLGSTGDLHVFTHADLRAATDDFSEKLGEGGFGVVYRGSLALARDEPKEDVAVKVLRQDGNQGFKEWQAEVLFLGNLRHKNLVRLFGYCYDGEAWMLVYEFVPNRSFDCHLFPRKGGRALGFRERIKVALGAAQGLAYLHRGEQGPVIFRDLKTSNILVDKDFNAKLSDFGLAREGPDGSRSHISTDIVGTSGYLAPEYITRGHVSERCDVFSFGVVLLEVITGRSAESEPEVAEESMVQWAARVAGESRDGWQLLIDPRLEGRYSPHSVKTTLKAAFMCIQQDPKARPTMENVIETLKVAFQRSMEDHGAPPGNA